MHRLSFLGGPWLAAWYVSIGLGNLLALITAAHSLVSGDWLGVILAPLLWPLWVLISAILLTIPLGIVFTCAVVVYKSTLSAYRALPFSVSRK